MTPEKIAPLAVYLASDRAEGISGQIFSVRNNEVFLFSQPRPIRSLHRADGWTPDKLDAKLKGAFAAIVHAARPLRRRVQLGPGVMAALSVVAMRLHSPAEGNTAHRGPAMD